MPVYNLTVDAPVGEYFANGVLVHNCDTMRYAVAYVDRLADQAGETDWAAGVFVQGRTRGWGG